MNNQLQEIKGKIQELPIALLPYIKQPDRRAFTLVELILVLAILGLLAALVVRGQEDACADEAVKTTLFLVGD